jgi:hypothetical protein
MAKHKQTSRPSEKVFADDQMDMFRKTPKLLMWYDQAGNKNRR